MEEINITGFVEKYAQINPDAPAIIGTDNKGLNYYQLHHLIKSLSKYLKLQGIRPNQRIAVVNPNGFEMTVSFLAIANVASFVPLSPDYSDQQYRYYCEILKTDFLVVPYGYSGPLLQIAKDMKMDVFNLKNHTVGKEVSFKFVGHSDHSHDYCSDVAKNDDIAMVNYTSGTTSYPKIVPRSHINAFYGVLKRLTDFPLGPDDRVLIITPMFRSVALNMLLTTLGSGGCAVCAGNFEPGQFFRLLQENKITWFTASPVVFHTIVEYAEKNRIDNRSFTIRFIRSSGAPLSENLARRIENVFNAPVYVTYGLTETGNISGTQNSPKGYKPGSVGVPLNIELKILNSEGKFLGKNSIGEIVVRGPQVIKKYDNDETINQQSFHGDWFRTGDSGYLDDDGYLFIIGRYKEIINRGGEKISPYEVEEAISRHPEVLNNAVFPITVTEGNEEIGTAIVLKKGAEISLKELRRFLDGKIVAFKMPTVLYIMDEIPASDAGKVQRKSLFETIQSMGIAPEPEYKTNEKIILPRNKTEIKLHKIFKTILPIKKISVTDTFFELGGDSLKAAILYDRIKTAFKMQIPLTYIFKNGSIEKLALYIMKNNDVKPNYKFAVPFQEKGSKTPVFFIHAAEGEAVIYRHIADKFDSQRPFYGISFNFKAAWHHPITFEQIAQQYISDIRSIQPEGPYILAGHCVGGMIAYEMACQLHEQKQNISLLAMFDSVIPGTEEKSNINQKLNRNINEFKNSDIKGVFNILSLKGFYYKIRLLSAVYKKVPLFMKPFVFKFMNKNAVIKYARLAYSIKKYDGDVVFFRHSDTSERTANNTINIWSGFARKVHVVSLTGDHNSVFYEDNAYKTRQVLENLLAEIP